MLRNLILTLAAVIFSVYTFVFSFSPIMRSVEQAGSGTTVLAPHPAGWIWVPVLAVVLSAVALFINVRSWIRVPARWYVWLVLVILSASALMASIGSGVITRAVDALGTQEAVEQSELQRIALYTYGLGTGRIVLDFSTSEVSELSIGHPTSSVAWYAFKAKLTEAEVRKYRSMVETSGLRDFSPQASWFPEYKASRWGPLEGGSDLVLTWNDREVVFGFPPYPPDVFRAKLPESAVEAYKTMDRIAESLDKTSQECRKTASLTVIEDPNKSPEIKRLHEEIRDIWEKSLPKDRKGW